jgi:hypothetical protein
VIPIVFLYFAFHGIWSFYMASFLLLDCIFLSDRLRTVINAVVIPFKDVRSTTKTCKSSTMTGLFWLQLRCFLRSAVRALCLHSMATFTAPNIRCSLELLTTFYQRIKIVATFILMGFIVYIFTAFGMYQFGGMIIYQDDALTIDGDQVVMSDGFSECPNLAVCFLEFFDVGLRSGDIVDATFDDLTYKDGIHPYFGRIIYGLAFFIVIGVILFDIVTGIIIDTFGSMREEASARRETIKSQTFMAGIERSVIESSKLNFDEINEVDQDKWNCEFTPTIYPTPETDLS